MNKITSAGKNDFNSLENDEINIKLILNFFFRNKFLIGSISLIFFVISVFYSLFQKKIWEGKFQIVLNPNQEQSSLSIVDPSIQDFLGGSQQKDLNTEVGILESPSLLMPIFESLIFNKNKEITFINWEKNLDINLEKGTSILNISYRDTDKEIIIPVLKKMTLAYQNYSGKSKKRRQELTKGYLKKQIAFYKQKSSESLEIAQNYATDQDLVYINMAVSSPLKMNNFEDEDYLDSNNFVFSPSIDIENIRVKASNDIREINAKIKKN